jgi:hypothetical protein
MTTHFNFLRVSGMWATVGGWALLYNKRTQPDSLDCKFQPSLRISYFCQFHFSSRSRESQEMISMNLSVDGCVMNFFCNSFLCILFHLVSYW